MWTVIGILQICCFGLALAVLDNGTPARTRAQPEARMQMDNLLAAIGTPGNRPTCMHDGRWYYERSAIPQVDSCINCKCENGMVRCNMTLCPMYPNVQEGCQLQHEEGACCPQLVCNENVAKQLSSVPEIHDATLLGCTYNDFEFGLGDFIPTSDPCQACYCIHNRTQCVHQNCALPESAREGCRPVYHHGICCPIRYDCAEAMAVPPTQRPAFMSEGCAVNSKLYDEGEAITSGKPCEHCYCMKGEMICAMQKCDTPMAGCVPVIKEGQCCPERFECPNLTTTPAPWNDTGVVFVDPVSTTRRKLSLNITIETKNFPHGQDKFSSTTRALDDDNEVLGDFQHTTAATVTSTGSDNIPTVTPPAAQLGFLNLNKIRSAQMTMRINGTQFPSANRRLPPLTPGLSSPWLPLNSSIHAPTDNPDVLQYNYNLTQEKVTPVSASEILNSAEPLATRAPNLGNGVRTGSDGETASANQSSVFASSSAVSSSGLPSQPVIQISLPPNATDNISVTHVVSGSTGLTMTSSSDVPPLNSNVSVASSSSGSLGLPIAVNINGTTIALAAGSKLIASASGNNSVRAVLLPPLDPSSADPFEGVIQLPQKPRSPAPATMVATDPENNSEIEGAASIASPAQQKLVQIPGAHLTEFGLAGAVDPASTDALEGQLTWRNVIKTDSTASKTPVAVKQIPFDPTSSAEVEGWLNSTPITAMDVRNNTAVSANVKNIVDPNGQTDVEGSFGVSTPAVKKGHSVPVDPTLQTNVEGLVSSSSQPGNGVPVPVPTDQSSTHSNIAVSTTAASPVDPHGQTDVEGAFVIAGPSSKNPIPTAADSHAQTVAATTMSNFIPSVKKASEKLVPFDPSDGAQVEGAWTDKTVSPKLPAITAVLVPLDPSKAWEIEGALNFNPSATTAGAPQINRETAFHPLDPSKATEVEGALSTQTAAPVSSSQTALGEPFDPSSNNAVEGQLSTLTVVRPAPPGSLHPTDPFSADQFEGALNIKLAVQQPANLVSGNQVVETTSKQPDITTSRSSTQTSTTTTSTSSTTLRRVDSTTTAPVLSARPSESSPIPFDPSAGGDVEGVLNWVTPVRKVADGVLHPTDPVGTDKYEGALSPEAASKNAVPSEPPANFTMQGSQQRPTQTLPPADPGAEDSAEGFWNIVVGPKTGTNPSASAPVTTQSPTNPPVPTGSNQVVTGQSSTPNTISVGGAAVMSDNSSAVSIPTATPGTPLLSGRPNGSVPANLIFTLATTKRKDLLPANQVINAAATSTDSKIMIVPSDPAAGDDFEGELAYLNKTENAAGQSAVPVDPAPTDAFEGILEHPNEVVNSDQTPSTFIPTTKPPWTIYSTQNNDSTVSRWIIQTKKTEPADAGRNVTWMPNSPNSGSDQIIVLVPLSTSTPTAIAASTTPFPSTLAPQSTTTTGTSLVDVASSTSSAASTESSTGVPSVLKPGDLDKLPSMVILENRRVTSPPTASVDITTSSGNTDSTSPPVWAGNFGLSSSFSNDSLPVVPAFEPGAPLTGIYENGCYYDGIYYRNYQSVPTSDLVDPCMVRLCRNGVVLGPSEQRCPPPIDGCFSTSIPGVCCPVYLCPNYLERNETSYTLTAASGDTLNTEKTKLALAKFCRVGPRFLALNERVVHVMGVQCQTCTCKPKGIVCEPGCAQSILITTEMPPVVAPRRFPTLATLPTSTLPPTLPPVTEPAGARSCMIHQKRFLNGDEVSFNDPCHICTCMDGLVVCKINRKGCRSSKILGDSDTFF